MRSMAPASALAARRLFLAATVVSLLLATTAPAALANKPDRAFAPAPDVIDLAAGDACAFPVTLEIPVNNEYATTFTQRSGISWIHVSGRLIVTVSHGAKSVELNVSGPGRIDNHPDGSTTMLFLGNGLIFDVGYILQTSGPVVLEVAADGSIASYDVTSAKVVDVCALVE
jgi:hypothetical protein